eukprot:4246523-Prymnesium_polylepis.1
MASPLRQRSLDSGVVPANRAHGRVVHVPSLRQLYCAQGASPRHRCGAWTRGMHTLLLVGESVGMLRIV